MSWQLISSQLSFSVRQPKETMVQASIQHTRYL